MRKFLVIMFLPFLVYSCSSTEDDVRDGVRVEEEESKDFSSSQMQKVKVETKNGSIESNVWDDDSIHVAFEKWAIGDTKEDAEDIIDDIQIFISEDTASGVLSIDVDIPSGEESYGCNIILDLPSSLSLDLESLNGAVTVSGSQSRLECFTSNGSIEIQDTKGNATLETSNGSITATDHYGDLNASTSNGAIAVEGIKLPTQGECILKTSNGAITLSIPDTTSAMIEASTVNGEIEMRGLDVIVIKMEETEFEGRIGAGEGVIKLKTSNGNILIKRK